MSLTRAVRARAACSGIALVGVLLVACGASSGAIHATTSGGPAVGAVIADGDWPTFDYNPQRSGIGPSSTGIIRANLADLKARTVHIDGVADSAAIQVRGVKVSGHVRDVDVVTTTYGHTIAFDPATGMRLWEYVPKDIGPHWPSGQITTASPVLDPTRRYVYAASPDGFVHKLAVATGEPVWKARVTFDATREKIEGGLNTSGRYVIAATGGYFGDAPTYQGHLALIDRASGHVAHVWNSLCSDRHHLIRPPSSCPQSDSAIWGRQAAVVEPGSGRLLVATGNGFFDGHTYWGDSVLELSPDAGRLLHNWTPQDQATLAQQDLDLGSTEPVLLPGTTLAVQGGKTGKLYLLDLRRLDGTTGDAGPKTGGQLQTLPSPASGDVLAAPIAFKRSHKTYLVVGGLSATAGYTLSGRRLHQVWEHSFAGTSPVIAGGLLYVYDPTGSLKILNPVSGHVLASLAAAPGHWSSPIVVGGRIVLPVGGSTKDDATSGKVFIYHLPGR